MSQFQTTPALLTNGAVQEYAELVGSHHRIYDDLGRADIDAFVHRIGGASEYAVDSESLHVRSPGDFTIFIPHHTSARRDRFTKAHELGHYFLHYLYPKSPGEAKFGRGGRDRAETEANVFASALLMPSEHFKRAHIELDGDMWQLSARFDVSPRAAEVRAEVLNLR
ncbi:ImmA/IrrE family metallo-endopeptidase [Rhodococcus erythropolis]|uniref:ImmA/IrrE family metallo-endopeptidase n=1 Tax=Rhodococcus erythropolis TaxID=1833 RepID=UPI002226BBD3|nr:ImmA/IrrE family metallo-endopeptidase [Rhodococcus erythropolis]MCW2300763.1 hypothetical protein [Rhodococcus erythropolis]